MTGSGGMIRVSDRGSSESKTTGVKRGLTEDGSTDRCFKAS